jgi:VWFA-related protein
MSCCRSTQVGCGWRSAAIVCLILRSVIPCFAQRSRHESQPVPQGEQEVKVSSRPYAPGLPPSDTLLVPVGVTVRDPRGHAVSGLKAADFLVTDQGQEVAVAGASQITRVKPAPAAMPRSIALCFDDYGSSSAQLLRAKAIVIEFVREGLRPGDLASVSSTFSKRVVDFTSDKQKLLGAIERLTLHATPSVVPDTRPAAQEHVDKITLMTKGDGALADNVSKINNRDSDEALKASLAAGVDSAVAGEFISQAFLELIRSYDNDLSHMPGGRVMLIVSPGFTGMPSKEQDEVVNQTVAAGVVINVLDSESSFREAPSSAAEPESALPVAWYNFNAITLGNDAAVADFAQSTGGLFFHRESSSFSHGYRELGDVPEVSYVLALPPGGGEPKQHRLNVELKAPGSNVVEARATYFPPQKSLLPEKAAEQAEDPSSLRAKLDAQVLSSVAAREFPFTVGLQPYSKLPDGKTSITVTLHSGVKELRFGTNNGRHTQKLTFVAAVLDDKGNLVSAKEGLMEFALSDSKFDAIAAEGVNASLVLEAAPGSYRLVTVGQDAEGKMASTVNQITVP